MKSVYIFFLLLIPLLGSSQKITVSEPIILRSDVAYDLIGNLGGNTLVFRDKGTSFEVVAFNPQMKEAWSKEIELDARQPKVIGLVAGKTDFTIVYQFRAKSHTIIKAHKYGPGANLLAVCQPTVPTLAAVARLAQENSPNQPAFFRPQ